MDSQPPHVNTSAELAGITMAVIGVLSFVYVLIRWPLVAFLEWGHRKLGERSWRVELAQLAAHEARLDMMDELATRVRDLEVQIAAVKELPEIKQTAVKAFETGERIEKAVEEISKLVFTTAQNVSEIRGALSRGADVPFRHTGQ